MVRFALTLPKLIHHLVRVIVGDRHQVIHQRFPHLQHSNAINNILAHIIFPKEMKEFPEKLSASGWESLPNTLHSLRTKTVGYFRYYNTY